MNDSFSLRSLNDDVEDESFQKRESGEMSNLKNNLVFE